MNRPQDMATWLWLPGGAFLLLLLVYLLGLNRELFLFFNSWQNTIPGVVWAHFTTFGDAAVAMAMILPFAGRRPDILWAAMLALVIGALVSQGLKDTLDVMRPPGVLPADQIMVYGPVHINDSFPTGHTLTAWTLASIMWLGLNRPWRGAILVLATLVGLSRMVLGVHWPMDVLGGMGLGWLVGQSAVYLSRRWRFGLWPWSQRIFVLLLGADTLGLFWYDNGHVQTLWMQYLIATFCLLGVIPVLRQLFSTREAEKA
jgi:membrane-associated phospholipid phosphatase